MISPSAAPGSCSGPLASSGAIRFSIRPVAASSSRPAMRTGQSGAVHNAGSTIRSSRAAARSCSRTRSDRRPGQAWWCFGIWRGVRVPRRVDTPVRGALHPIRGADSGNPRPVDAPLSGALRPHGTWVPDGGRSAPATGAKPPPAANSGPIGTPTAPDRSLLIKLPSGLGQVTAALPTTPSPFPRRDRPEGLVARAIGYSSVSSTSTSLASVFPRRASRRSSAWSPRSAAASTSWSAAVVFP